LGGRLREWLIDHKPLSVLQLGPITVKGPQIVFVPKATIDNNWRVKRGRLYCCYINFETNLAQLVGYRCGSSEATVSKWYDEPHEDVEFRVKHEDEEGAFVEHKE